MGERKCDLQFGDHIIRDCLVIPTMRTSLLSEGLLSLSEPFWEFTRTRHGLSIAVDEQCRYQGYRKSVMCYTPQDMMRNVTGVKSTPSSPLIQSQVFADCINDSTDQTANASGPIKAVGHELYALMGMDDDDRSDSGLLASEAIWTLDGEMFKHMRAAEAMQNYTQSRSR